jgi:AAA domain
MSLPMSFVFHAGSKVGKSTLAATAPGPKLIVDAEASYRFYPGYKIFWDPLTEPIPVIGQGRIDPAPGSPVYSYNWDTCVVIVREYQQMRQAVDYLRYYVHPFTSFIADSISEIQDNCKESITGRNGEMDRGKWGALLADMLLLCRDLRNLTVHPTNPLQCVVLTAQTVWEGGKWRPYVQGQLKTKLPYLYDVIGYEYVMEIPPPPGSNAALESVRVLAVEPGRDYEAGNRIQETEFTHKLPALIGNPSIPDMITAVFGPERQVLAA